MTDDEVLENMVPGQYNDTKGLLVATNKRLIFVSKRWFSSNVEEFIFDKISAVETSAGKSDGELEIRNADDASAKFKSVPGDHLQPFAEYLKGRRPESPSQDTDQELRAEAPLDWVSRLDRLAALKSQGSISDEDFEAERTRILKGL